MHFIAPLRGGLQTNKRAEFSAPMEVLRTVPGDTYLQLCVDSQLVTDGATSWPGGWRTRGWKTKQGHPIQSWDLWQDLYAMLQGRTAEAEWVKVPSHVDLGSLREAAGAQRRLEASVWETRCMRTMQQVYWKKEKGCNQSVGGC